MTSCLMILVCLRPCPEGVNVHPAAEWLCDIKRTFLHPPKQIEDLPADVRDAFLSLDFVKRHQERMMGLPQQAREVWPMHVALLQQPGRRHVIVPRSFPIHNGGGERGRKQDLPPWVVGHAFFFWAAVQPSDRHISCVVVGRVPRLPLLLPSRMSRATM